MNKLSLIRPLDLATFGLPSAAIIALTTYAYSNGTTGEPLALLVVLSLAFLGIYAAYMIYRYRFIKRIDYTTQHGLHVITNSFDVPQPAVENITEDTISGWNFVLSKLNGGKDYRSMCEDSIKDLLVKFEPFPIHHTSMGKLAGYAVGDNIVVGYKDKLSDTALAHELGHYIHKAHIGRLTNKECHDFMRTHGLK